MPTRYTFCLRLTDNSSNEMCRPSNSTHRHLEVTSRGMPYYTAKEPIRKPSMPSIYCHSDPRISLMNVFVVSYLSSTPRCHLMSIDISDRIPSSGYQCQVRDSTPRCCGRLPHATGTYRHYHRSVVRQDTTSTSIRGTSDLQRAYIINDR